MCGGCDPSNHTVSRRSYLKKTAGATAGLTVASGTAVASDPRGRDDVRSRGDDPGEMWIDMFQHESASDDWYQDALDGAEAFAEWMTEHMDYPTSVFDWGTISESIPDEDDGGAYHEWAEYIEENCAFTGLDQTYSMVVIGDDDHLLGRNIGQWLDDGHQWPGAGGYVNTTHLHDWISLPRHVYNIVGHEILHSLMDRSPDDEHAMGDWSIDGETHWLTAKPTVMATGYAWGGTGSNPYPDDTGCNYDWNQGWFIVEAEPCVTDCTVVTLWADLPEAGLPPYEKYHHFTDYDVPSPATTERRQAADITTSDGRRPQEIETDALDDRRSRDLHVDRPQPSPTDTSRSERPGAEERRIR